MTHEKIVTDRAIGAATPEELETPTLRQQTQTLGETLKHIADNDPAGTPTEQAIAVFHEWLEAAGATSERPELFTDVVLHYDALSNTNRDLFLLFDMMVNHAEIEEEPLPLATFIGLPLIGS